MTGTPWVAVTNSYDFPVDEAVIAETLRGKAEYRLIELPHKPLAPDEEDDLIARIRGAEALFVRPGIISRRVIHSLPDLRIIAVHGAGVDQVDIVAATEAGVVVTNVPGGNANAVAELTLGLLLALLRRIPQSSWMVQREHKWDEARWMGSELRGKTIGVVGWGYVGKRVIALADAFGMSVLAHDPYLSAEAVESLGAVPRGFQELLASSDVVTTHVPLTPQTHHLIGEEQLAQMRQGALLVNTSRGAVIDVQALYEALASGHLAGAALDVMEQEPPPPDHPLFSLPNVIVTPHAGGSTYEVLATLARVACEDIVRVLEGQPPLHPVNPVVLTA
jgi:D-3-phosphoglycerate dehydrogenase